MEPCFQTPQSKVYTLKPKRLVFLLPVFFKTTSSKRFNPVLRWLFFHDSIKIWRSNMIKGCYNCVSCTNWQVSVAEIFQHYLYSTVPTITLYNFSSSITLTILIAFVFERSTSYLLKSWHNFTSWYWLRQSQTFTLYVYAFTCINFCLHSWNSVMPGC